MGFNDFLKKIFGNKSQRDLREIQPIVAEINKIYPTLENLSNDELRDRITKIRAALKDSVADKRKEIADIMKTASRTGRKSTKSRKTSLKCSKTSLTNIFLRYLPSCATPHAASLKMNQSK